MSHIMATFLAFMNARNEGVKSIFMGHDSHGQDRTLLTHLAHLTIYNRPDSQVWIDHIER